MNEEVRLDSREGAPHARSAPRSLRGAALRGVVWNVSGRVFDRLVEFIRIIVLGHLLTRADFGIFGMVALTDYALRAFTYLGPRQALIRLPRDPRPLFDTAFVLEVGRGAFLTSIIFLGAPLIAWQFGEPKLVPLLQAYSFTLLFLGLVNIGTIEFDRKLEFHKSVSITRIASMASLTAGIASAVALRSPWAFVIAELARTSTLCALSYFWHPYRPKFRFDWNYAKEIFSFGVWQLFNAIGLYFQLNVDSLIIAKRLGTEILGTYQMGYKFGLLPANSLTDVIRNVTFPIFSRINQDRQRMRTAFGRIFLACMSITVPTSLLLFCFGNEVIHFIMGEKWASAGPVVCILALFGLGQLVIAAIEPIFDALGRPQFTTISRTSHLVVLFPLAWWLTVQQGTIGAALAVTIACLVPVCILVVSLCIHLPGLAKQFFLGGIGLSISGAALVGTAVSLRGDGEISSLLETILAALAGSAAYIATLAAFDRILKLGLADAASQIIEMVRKRIDRAPADQSHAAALDDASDLEPLSIQPRTEWGMRRASVSVQWRLIGSLAERVSNIVALGILARLIAKADFGLVALANSAVTLVGMLRDVGVSQAIVQAPRISPTFVSTCFWVRMTVGVGLYLVLASIALPIASFYQESTLPELLLTMGTAFFLDALPTVQQSLLMRDLRVREATFARVASLAAGLIVGVVLGWKGYGPWALVFNSLTTIVTSGLILTFMTRWIPQFRINANEFRHLLHFGGSLTGTQLLGWFTENFSIAALGKVAPIEQLGVFRQSYVVGKWPDSLLGSVFGGGLVVSLFSKIQHDTTRMRDVLRQATSLMYLGGLPLAVFIVLMTRPLIRVVYGPDWDDAIPICRIITIGGTFLMLRQTLRHWLIAAGHPSSLLWNQVVTAIAAVTLTLVGAFWGVMGVTIATTAACAMESIVLWVANRHITGLGLWAWFKNASPSMAVALLVGGGLWLFTNGTSSHALWGRAPWQLLGGSGIAAAIWCLSAAVLAPRDFRFLLQMFGHWLPRRLMPKRVPQGNDPAPE